MTERMKQKTITNLNHEQKRITLTTEFIKIIKFALNVKPYDGEAKRLRDCSYERTFEGEQTLTTSLVDPQNCYHTKVTNCPQNIDPLTITRIHELTITLTEEYCDHEGDEGNMPPIKVERFDESGYQVDLNNETHEWELV